MKLVATCVRLQGASAAEEKELLEFGGSIMGMLRKQVKEQGAAHVTPCVYLWPGEGLGLDAHFFAVEGSERACSHEGLPICASAS